MSFLEKIKAKVAEELATLKTDGRSLEDKLQTVLGLGAMHARLTLVEERFRAEVDRLKDEAEVELRKSIVKLRDELNAEADKIKNEFKS